TTATRVLLNAKWDLLDDVHAVVTLRKNDRAWGTATAGGEGASGSQAIDAAGVLGNTFVDRAAVSIDKLGGYIDTTIGRQYYGDPGDLVIYYGSKDNFGLYNTAIDAARFEYANDWMAFSGLAGKTAGTKLTTVPTTDTNVRGFDVLWKSLPMKLHTFLWNRVTQMGGQIGTAPSVPAGGGASTSGGLNDNLWVYGVKLRGEAMGGWVNLDLAANAGEDRLSGRVNSAGADGTIGTADDTQCGAAGCNAMTANYIGKAFMFDAGYNAEMTNIGALTPWVNFGWGTGRSSNLEKTNEGFTSIASDYRPGIMNRMFDGTAAANLGSGLTGGTIGTNGLNNRVVYGAGLNFTPAAWEKLTVGAQ
ncbi:MAG: hypothetical protein KGL53_12365, partial [Elusimicrobia bacterium]|nr:hypothetical protein [Elusimicrobiota bacterium]